MAFLSPVRTRIRSGLIAVHRTALGLVAFLALATISPAVASEPATPSEYQLKAVFLYNFAQFVEWPASVFPHPDSPVVIGVLGPDPFGKYLDELIAGEKVGTRALEIHRYERVEDVRDCHILFVADPGMGALERILGLLKQRSILTVGDVDGFSRLGGMVRFVNEGGKIRLRINVEAARASGLTISSKILRPDMIVTTGHD